MGYPLSQTLFTSVHIDRLLWPDPKSVLDSTFMRNFNPSDCSFSHQVLRVFCLLLIKSCDLVMSMVTSQHFYEVQAVQLVFDFADSRLGGGFHYSAIPSRASPSLPCQGNH